VLLAIAPPVADEPNVVVLSPGVYNYFFQATLGPVKCSTP